VQASEVSRSDDLQGVTVERLIGDDPFEAPILILERLHLCDVSDLYAAELRFPLVERRRAYAVLAAKLARPFVRNPTYRRYVYTS